MAEYCNHLKELLEAESPFVIKEIEKNRYYLSEKERHDVGEQEAKKDYLENYLSNWGQGFSSVYCLFTCSEKSCGVLNRRRKKLKVEIKKHKSSLKRKLKKNVLFEEASQDYFFKLGHSYLEGVADAVSFIKSKSKNSF